MNEPPDYLDLRFRVGDRVQKAGQPRRGSRGTVQGYRNDGWVLVLWDDIAQGAAKRGLSPLSLGCAEHAIEKLPIVERLAELGNEQPKP